MKERLDKVLLSKGLVKTREMAQAFIIEGKVFVDGKKITKPGAPASEDSDISLQSADLPYVGRGGLKLEAALNFFKIHIENRVVMDVGSSTGGFTDCMLQRGAMKVYCIDVGYGQLAWSVRQDPRVVLLERTNIRYLDAAISDQQSAVRKDLDDLLRSNIDMAAIDVSFISLTKVIPVVIKFLKEKAGILALVKPQFEVGKGEVGKGGIVRREEKRLSAVKAVVDFVETLGLKIAGVLRSPLPGQKGNIEYLLYIKRGLYG